MKNLIMILISFMSLNAMAQAQVESEPSTIAITRVSKSNSNVPNGNTTCLLTLKSDDIRGFYKNLTSSTGKFGKTINSYISYPADVTFETVSKQFAKVSGNKSAGPLNLGGTFKSAATIYVYSFLNNNKKVIFANSKGIDSTTNKLGTSDARAALVNLMDTFCN